MRILVCNDDGIEAPGLAFLAKTAARLSDDVWVVAPEVKHTAASGSITIAKVAFIPSMALSTKHSIFLSVWATP